MQLYARRAAGALDPRSGGGVTSWPAPYPSAAMALFQRRPDLPPEHHDAWWTFLDCAQAIEAGRRVLLGTLPTGRVEPAPIAVGVDALQRSLHDVRAWMPAWRLTELEADWADCMEGMDRAESELQAVLEVAAETDELEELLTAVTGVIDPLDSFADAERAWRRLWKPPRDR